MRERGDRLIDRREQPILSDALEQTAPGQAPADVLSRPGDRERDLAAVEVVERLAQGTAAGVVEEVIPIVSSTTNRGVPIARVSATWS